MYKICVFNKIKAKNEKLSKSFKRHKSFGEKINVNYKPQCDQALCFHLLLREIKFLTPIYTFMGYWLRKRNITVVTALLTSKRLQMEKKIALKNCEINSTRSFVFRGSHLIKDIIKKSDDFKGSLEIEIFSAVDMVFPFPAITFAFEGVNGLTFVHTCGRIYK